MTSRASHWIALFLCLWLPLQGFAAPLMPFCRHHQPAPASEAVMPCHAQHADAQAEPSLVHDQDCDGCSLCHMAASPAFTAGLPLWAAASPAVDLPVYTVRYPSHDPTNLWRPPRLA